MSNQEVGMKIIRAANAAAIAAGAPYSSDCFILDTSTGDFWFSRDGADPQKTSLTVPGINASSGAGVDVQDVASGNRHTTVITLTDVELPIVSVTTGAGVGGVEIFGFPQGYVRFQGGSATLSLAVETEGDFTDGTPEGQLGVGTLAPANADALGTDATDDNFLTATDFTMTDYVDASVVLPTEAVQLFDGRVTPINLILTGLVDAGDIDDDTTTNLLVSGTVTIIWDLL